MKLCIKNIKYVHLIGQANLSKGKLFLCVSLSEKEMKMDEPIGKKPSVSVIFVLDILRDKILNRNCKHANRLKSSTDLGLTSGNLDG